jgi:hypothetical protein
MAYFFLFLLLDPNFNYSPKARAKASNLKFYNRERIISLDLKNISFLVEPQQKGSGLEKSCKFQ